MHQIRKSFAEIDGYRRIGKMKKWIKSICNLLIILVFFGLLGYGSPVFATDITDLEGTTGYVGKEDIKWGTGQPTDTFTVTTYDGGSATLTKLPDPDAADESIIKGVWYVAAMAGDHGNAALTGSLAWVIAVLDGDPATVILPGDQTYQISTDLTVPATVYLVMHRGAIFSVDNTKTLTINGDIQAGAYQIFSGAGTITLGANILEHDQWRDGAGDAILPSADNAIDLGSSAQRFKAIYPDNLNAVSVSGHAFRGYVIRPKFTWKDDDEIYIDAGVYYHNGTTEQLLYWDSQITYQFTSLAASDWSYLYIDDSAIVTAGTNLITASEFTDSTTEPSAYSNTKHGRYHPTNTNDMCIFAVLTDGSSHILEFFHDDSVRFADEITIWSAEQPSDTWTDCPLNLPSFSTRADVNIITMYIDQTATAFCRVNGQTGSGGCQVGYVTAALTHDMRARQVITDTSQKIEGKFNASTGNYYNVYVVGWYFPNGM